MRNTRRLEFFRASGFRDKEVDSLFLIFDKPIPEFKALQDSRQVFKRQGGELAQALIEHLPGGLVDQVLAKLLENRASLLHIANKL